MIAGLGDALVLPFVRRGGLAVVIALLLGACSETTRAARASGNDWWQTDTKLDELPHMLNAESPFRYPTAEFARRIEGNVMLRLHVDTSGMVLPDSTRVSESSGIKALDKAAVSGASLLRFKPARVRGAPIAVSMLFPVHFRLPESTTPVAPRDSLQDLTPDSPLASAPNITAR